MQAHARCATLAIVFVLGAGCATEPSAPQGGGTPVAGNAATVPSGGTAGMLGASGAGAGDRAGAPSTPPTGSAGASAAGSGGTVDPGSSGAGSAGVAGLDPGAAGVAGGAGAGTAGAAGAAGAAEPGPGFPQLPRVDTTDGPGPFAEVVKVKDTPPGGWLIYPKDIGMGGMKHPIFIFGPGGGTTPQTYEDSGMHWDRYGSYGFVIYVLPMSTGDGAAMKEGLDWVIMQNDDSSSPLYQHLDTSKVCAAGHSQGSITTFDFMPDERVTTTIHISGGSFDHMGPTHLRNDTMFMCAPDASGDPAKPQCDGDFMTSTVPTFYTVVTTADHLTSARLGWAATIAWMLWHLAGQEDQWKKEFLEPTGQFQTGIFMSQTKNW